MLFYKLLHLKRRKALVLASFNTIIQNPDEFKTNPNTSSVLDVKNRWDSCDFSWETKEEMEIITVYLLVL